MALAARRLPLLLLYGPLRGWAARPRTPGPVEAGTPPSGLCRVCRRLLGWAVAPLSRNPARPVPGARRPLLPAALSRCPARPLRCHSTDEQPQPRQKTKMIILGFSNPVTWVRTRVYAFLIWAYFDPEFSIAEFVEGAKQVCLPAEVPLPPRPAC